MTFKVFIVDDEPIIVKSLEKTIHWQEHGCVIAGTAENGTQALESMNEIEPDLVLTDIRMPLMNGLELLKEASRLAHQPKVILLSGYDEFEYAREGLKYNAFDYILKPIDYEQVEECISRVVQELKLERKEKYEHLKQIIYNHLTLTQVEDELPESRLFEVVVAQVENDGTGKQELFYKWANQQSYKYHESDFFIYKFNHKQLAIIITDRLKKTEEIQPKAKSFIQEMLSFFNQNCVIAIGNPVMNLSDLYDSFVQAQELIKMGSVLKLNVISEDAIKDYKGRNSAIDLIDEAKAYLEDHFNEDIGMEQVADKIGLSVSYFSVIFKQQTGMTLLEYLTTFRIERACILLRSSEMMTYEIAQKVGYFDQRYFSQVFKKKLNMTPSEYRKKYMDSYDSSP
ncbi:response regulator [Cohnella sp. CFH 77786]|uniref:response regulator transcription factor n=1 Tax=Cohnella sp. CFH 77786 TaxID=2662265 RepID=UPI001C60AE77|nr:response regulator [Cohnella sp. CFH 77786]